MNKEKKYVDPLFDNVVESSSNEIISGYNLPTGLSFIQCTVGTHGNKKIPALVNQNNRLCLPVKDSNKS